MESKDIKKINNNFQYAKISHNNILVKGPHQYISYDIMGKNITLFGEWHVDNPICSRKAINFDEFLIKLVLDSKNPIDLFLEVNFINTHDQEFITGVSLAGSKYIKHCINKNKENINCYDGKLRIHYIDTRLMKKHSNDIDIEDIYDITYKYMLSPHVITLFNISQLDKNNFIYSLYNIINKSYKINKQYENISNKKLKDSIIYFFNQRFKIDSAELLESKNIENTRLIIRRLINLVMDKYAIGRLFREFITDKPIKITTNNVIFYTGINHINLYNNLFGYLQNIGFDIKVNSYSESIGDTNCVDVDISNLIF